MWKIIKKILRTLLIWSTIALMAVNVFAYDDYLTPVGEIYPYVYMNDFAGKLNVYGAKHINQRPYGNTDQYELSILSYESCFAPNTFYHITYVYDMITNGQLPANIKTGLITEESSDLYASLFPVNTLSPYLEYISQSNTNEAFVSLPNRNLRSVLENNKISSLSGAKVYYYLSKNNNQQFQIDVLLYFNEQFFQNGWDYDASHAQWMQCYFALTMAPGPGAQLVISKHEVYDISQKPLYDKLDTIISKLNVAGGGLTKEDVEAAVAAALEQHDAAEEQKGNNKIQQIKQQIESITEPYKENLTSLQDATRSITSALNYSGTNAVLTLPEARNPMTDNSLLWEEKQIDLGYYWEQLPQALRSAISIILTFLILYKVIIEMVDEITWVIYMDKNVDKAERNAIGL